MAKLFNVIDNRFFSVLSAPNKELYLDCILEIYQRVDELESMQENTKERIVDSIEYLVESREAEDIYEEDANELFDARSKARYIVNHIKECGWIYEEDLGHNVILINFKTDAIKVVRLLREIAQGTKVEHTGYLKSIYLLTQDFYSSKEIAQIEQIYRQTDELTANLKALKSMIFTYYNGIAKKTAFENAQQILEELLRYKDDFFDKAYWNFKTYDNLSKYKDSILKTIKSIKTNEEVMDELTRARLDETYKTEEAAENFIIEKLDYVVDSFTAIDRLTQAIDDKNRKYIQAAISKVMFYVNRSDDFEGIFNRLVELINDKKLEYGKDYRFNLFDTKNLDKMSLYTAREVNRCKVELDVIGVAEVDNDFADERIKDILRNAEFSYDEIGKYAQALLKGKLKVRASEMPSESNQNFVKIILIYLYSKSYDCKFKVESLNEKVTINGVTFNDFVLERGEK